MKIKILIFFIFFYSLIYGVVIKEEIKDYKQHLNETRKKIEQIREKIKEEREKIAKAKIQEKKTYQYLQQLERELSITKKELNVFENNIKILSDGISDIEKSIKEKEKFIKEKEKVVMNILRNQYKKQNLEIFNLILSSKNIAEVITRYKFFNILSKKNISDIEAYKLTIEKLKEEKDTLIEYKNEVEKLKQLKEEQWKTYKNQKWEKHIWLKNIKKDITKSQQVIDELKKNEKKLNGLIEKLQVTVELEDKEAKEAFLNYKGKFPWPVDSRKILAGFGYYNHPKFKSKVVSNGIHIAERYNAPVSAIFKGIVKYADWFEGYGNMVIIYHGGGFYSIYGHLAEIYVNVGDRVNVKSLIGTVGDTESFFGNELYFELRQNTNPVNPLKYLSR